MIPPQHRKKAAAISIAVCCVTGFEGLRHYAYRDVVGVPTYCVGETHGVRFGHYYSTEECQKILGGELEKYAAGVERCAGDALPPYREAALISFAYNVGLGAFCRSSVAQKIAAGDVRGGCDALLKYDRAGGIVFDGLRRRRAKEREMCLKEG